jgi:hypothetical protein
MSALLYGQGRIPSPGRTPIWVEESGRFLYRSLEDDHGGFFVVWTHEQNGAFSLVAQRVGPDGKAFWSLPGNLLAEQLPDADAWDAFPDGQGGLALSWTNATGLFAQRFSSDGKPLWPGQPAVLLSTGSCASPAGVSDAARGAYVVWSEKRMASRQVLIAQHVNADGTLLWRPEGLRVSLRPSDQRNPAVVTDGQAGAIVAWKDFRENASQIQSQRMDYQGDRLWGEEGIVVTAPAGAAHERPLLSPGGDGGAAIAWLGARSGANRLFMQSLSATGHFRWAPEGVPLSFGNSDQWNPSLFGDGEGTVWMGWEDYRNQTHWQVFAESLSSRKPVDPDPLGLPLAPAGSDQGHVALADNGRDGVFAAWLDNRSSGSGVYVQEVDANAQPLLGEVGQAVVERLINPSTPQLVGLAPGRVSVIVADREKKNRWALYWTVVNGPSIP